MKPAVQIAVAAVLLAGATYLTWRHFAASAGPSEQAFFYDLSEKKLFPAPRGLVPPIAGMNDAVEDGVRAVVFSPTGRPEDKRTWQIAYLETYAPELKRELEAARSSGEAPRLSRTAAQGLRRVRLESDPEWVALDSPEGERIVSRWTQLGVGGQTPAICTP